MKKFVDKESMPAIPEVPEGESLSRRKWLKQVSVPVVATSVGAGFFSGNGYATEKKRPNEAKENTTLIYNIRDFGAKGDGKSLDTLAVQTAIDTCSRENGGIVLVPSGDFLVGTLELKSNVSLYLSVQGRLLGSPQRKDYHIGKGVPSGNGNLVLIYAVEAENIAIEGRGTIDGNGQAFFTGEGDNTGPGSTEPGYFDRPHLIILYRCHNILLRDSFFTRSAYHCFRILDCNQINVDGVRIYNRSNRNNDGFHFNSCQYVQISNSDIICQDDACALFGSNRFVTVSNCTFSTRWSIFRFGSGATQDIAVSNCLIYDTYGCPVKISSRHAQIENFTFSNIIMKNVTGPIGIGFSGSSDSEENSSKPFLRNISFNGIRATVVPEPVNHSDMPFGVNIKEGEQDSCITFNGVGNAYLENISLTDVQVTYSGGGTAEQAGKEVPEVAREYFGVWATAPFGPPAYGLYARNVRGLILHNVRFEFENVDLRPAIVLEKVRDASINGLNVQGHPNSGSVLRFKETQDVYIAATRLLTPASVFLKVEGESSQGILVDGGDLSKAGKVLVFENGATKEAARLRI